MNEWLKNILVGIGKGVPITEDKNLRAFELMKYAKGEQDINQYRKSLGLDNHSSRVPAYVRSLPRKKKKACIMKEKRAHTKYIDSLKEYLRKKRQTKISYYTTQIT